MEINSKEIKELIKEYGYLIDKGIMTLQEAYEDKHKIIKEK